VTSSPSITDDPLLQQAIALHRDDTSVTLNFTPCLVRLLDNSHCQMVSESLRALGSDWEIRAAQPDLYYQLPMRSGLYMFVWNPDLKLTVADGPKIRTFPWILYIGQAGAGSSTNTLRDRYKSTYAKLLSGDPNQLFASGAPANRYERLSRYLRLRPLEYWWKEIPDQSIISRLEKALVAAIQPPLNSQHNHGRLPVRRGTSTRAFQER
jgi:hypothetical protein